jgi:hypothetical protein
MDFILQGAPVLRQRGGIEREVARQAEQHEVVVIELHGCNDFS